MGKEVQFTREGYEKLKHELEDLKGPVRLRIAQAIREAKSHGDLKENAAYHEAKLNQTRLESRISELEKAFDLAKVIEKREDASLIGSLGSKIKLIDLEFDDELTVTLVGSYEADPSKDLISIASPLGEALLDKKAKDEIQVEAPGGMTRYRVLSIE